MPKPITLRVAALVAVVVTIGGCGQSPTTQQLDANEPAPAAPPSAPAAPPPPPPAAAPPTSADAAAPDAGGGPFLAVFSAFPAETAPLVARATITSTTVANGKTFRVGTLGGVRVAIGLTGMGLSSATATAHALLAQLPITGVVFSGVAGSKSRIGDVAIPATWSLKTTGTYATDAAWSKIAAGLVASGSLCLEKCTVVPATGLPVCLDHVPAAIVGGIGQSDDVSAPVSCQSGGDDVFGCDLGAATSAPGTCAPMGAAGPDAGAAPIVNDNETAAVAAEAAARGLPFIAFRGVSDGSGDPLGLPGYPAQFFAYYRLAARNAAAVTIAFVAKLGS